MRKFLLVALVSLVLLSGCGNKLKSGVYEGSAVDDYNNENNLATAKVTIDENGKITDVYLDTTYTKDGIETTKKTLKDEYGMYNNSYGSQIGEWYTQVEALEKAIVEHQGVEFLNLDEDGYTDAVSSCTIKISALVKAYEDAISMAK
jgi:major membrane immunogen (membrane-anchored lipoprotein)